MKRREFLGALSGATIAWPMAARAQQSAMAVIGFIHSATPAPNRHIVDAFRQGLKDAGIIEGRNAAIEYLWAEGQYDRLPAMANDLVRRHVSVIVAGGNNAPVQAAKAATRTIPIVFVSGDDPVQAGVVPNLNRPGGNVTGVVFFNSALATKRIELLHELLPSARVVAYLVNPNSPEASQETRDVLAAAQKFGLAIHVLNASSQREIDDSRTVLSQLGAQALLTAADPFLGSQRARVIALAAHSTLPVFGSTREYVADGAVISYGTSNRDAYRQCGSYVGRILKGEKPSDLPVTQPTTFELSVNVKAATALGIVVPPTLLARADEVIE